MPSAPTTNRLQIVVMPASLTVLNEALRSIDPTSTGDPITTPVQRADDPAQPGATAAYVASWAMDDMTRSAANKAFANLRPFQGSEGTVLGPSDPVPAFGSQRWWLFDGYTVPMGDALRSLGLSMLVYPPR